MSYRRGIPRPSGIEIILFSTIVAFFSGIIFLLTLFFKRIHKEHAWLLFFLTFSSFIFLNLGMYYIYNTIHYLFLLYSFLAFCAFWGIKFLISKPKYSSEGWLSEDYWRELDSFDFEEEIANLFRGMGYKAKVTQKTVDYGVDVITWINNVKVAVQCKRYNEHPATCSEVRDLWGAKEYYNCKGAIMVALDGITRNGYNFISKFENYDFMTISDIIEKAREVEEKEKKNGKYCIKALHKTFKP